MIERLDENLVEVGYLIKSHGLNGEMNAVIDAVLDSDQLECLFLKVGGIATPFFVADLRETSSRGVLIRFDDVVTQEQMRPLLSARVLYAHREDVLETAESEDEYELMGYELHDEKLGTLGTISGIDDATANVLWRVARSNGDEILVPVAEDYVVEVDDSKRIITVLLPEGFPL